MSVIVAVESVYNVETWEFARIFFYMGRRNGYLNYSTKGYQVGANWGKRGQNRPEFCLAINNHARQ